MASTSAPRRSAAETFLPDVIWEDIFLRLGAAADLARASAVCSSFRGIVSEPKFLRRFRTLHSPPILGFLGYGCREFLPVGPPHRSAPEAHALDLAADFTFSFIPDPSAWSSCDARDGRVLLSRRISTKTEFQDFMVCDPLHRRYVKIPRIPDDLLASAAGNGMARDVLPVLVPAGKNDGEESFRIICSVQDKSKGKVVVLVFSSCNQTWRGIISTISLPGFIEYVPYYAHNCLFWMLYCMGYSLVLDTSDEMKFSIIDIPPHKFANSAIVGAEEGELWFLTIGDDTIDLYCKNWQSNGVGTQEWQRDKLIPLPKHSGINYNVWTIVGTVEHYSALQGTRQVSHESLQSEYFVLDTKTLLLEKVCTSSNVMDLGIPYARFPPPFAPPSI